MNQASDSFACSWFGLFHTRDITNLCFLDVQRKCFVAKAQKLTSYQHLISLACQKEQNKAGEVIRSGRRRYKGTVSRFCDQDRPREVTMLIILDFWSSFIGRQTCQTLTAQTIRKSKRIHCSLQAQLTHRFYRTLFIRIRGTQVNSSQ